MIRIYKKRIFNIIVIIMLSFAIFALLTCSAKNIAENDSASFTKEKKSISDYLENETDNVDNAYKDSISNYLENDALESENQTETTIEEANAIEELQENGVIETLESVSKNINTSFANDNIEYDVYKKVDFSQFIRNEETNGQNALIEHSGDGIVLSNKSCKVTFKANVKIEKGAGFDDNDLNDALALIINFDLMDAYIYYADYGDNFFGSFHEVERAAEYYNGRAGKGLIGFSVLGLAGINGSSGYIEKYVSNDNEEYVGEILTKDGQNTKIKVIIKDVYYKISRPTGTVSEWDLNKDFTVTNFYGTQCFEMRELDKDYNYILKPKFVIDIDSQYDQRQAKYLNFYYTSNINTPDLCTSIITERENDFEPRYTKIGVGVQNNKWRKASDNSTVDVSLSWDKNSKTITAKDKDGNVAGTIKIDYIKEYKYKRCIENDTPGYKKYVMATNQSNVERDIKEDKNQKDNAAADIARKYYDIRVNEENDRRIVKSGIKEKTVEFGEHKVKYKMPVYQCNNIPNLNDMVEKAVDECIQAFFTEYYIYVDKDADVDFQGKVPTYTSLDAPQVSSNCIYLLSKKQSPKDKSHVEIELYIYLNDLRYCYNGFWQYGQMSQKKAINFENSSRYGMLNRRYVVDPRGSYSTMEIDMHSFGYKPLITDWYYKPIENIASIEDANVGDYIHYGKFYYAKNYNRDLEWLVLDKTDDKMLITTRDAIDCRKFNDGLEFCTWENSTIRTWLNNTFFNNAFSAREKNKVVEDVDKVFLLSKEEVDKYFASDKDRQCKASFYAQEHQCWYSIINGMCHCCYYWLRTSGYKFDDDRVNIMYVNHYGEVNTTGEEARSIYIGIRLAMWVKYK